MDPEETNWETEEMIRWMINDEQLYQVAVILIANSRSTKDAATELAMFVGELRQQLDMTTEFGKFVLESYELVDWTAVAKVFEEG